MAQVVVFHDDSDTEALLVAMCEEEGHEIVAAVSTVEQALHILRTTPSH